jgi:hypothetical protein
MSKFSKLRIGVKIQVSILTRFGFKDKQNHQLYFRNSHVIIVMRSNSLKEGFLTMTSVLVKQK